MTWLATVALLCAAVLLVYLGWCWGVWAERREQASREEAIRWQAHKDGRTWMFHEMMATNPGTKTREALIEEFRHIYAGTWTAPENHETKESS